MLSATLAPSEPASDLPPAEPRREPGTAEPGAWQVLDDPQEWGAFSRPHAGRAGCVESHLVVQGITCAACAVTIEDALRRMPGVLGAEVSAGSHRARVVWSPEPSRPTTRP